jgi:hypothetical protein
MRPFITLANIPGPQVKIVEVAKHQDGEPTVLCVIEPADVAPI